MQVEQEKTEKFTMLQIEQEAERKKEQRNQEYVMKKWKLSNLS